MNQYTQPTDHASKEVFWRHHVTEFQDCNMSAAAFCRQRNLSYKSFMKWQHKLTTQDSQTTASNHFIRVQTTQPVANPLMMTCRLPNGFELSWDTTASALCVAAFIQEVNRL